MSEVTREEFNTMASRLYEVQTKTGEHRVHIENLKDSDEQQWVALTKLKDEGHAQHIRLAVIIGVVSFFGTGAAILVAALTILKHLKDLIGI